MRKWILKLTMALLLALTLSLPSFAWLDHGSTYTAIDALDSERFTTQGEVTLPTLSNQFALGLHVDIVDDLEDYSISDYAALFYDQYGYGSGAEQDGVLLMIYATDQGGTVDLWTTASIPGDKGRRYWIRTMRKTSIPRWTWFCKARGLVMKPPARPAPTRWISLPPILRFS